MDTNPADAESSQHDQATSRRRLLGSIGAAGLTATTGCLAWTDSIGSDSSAGTPTRTAQSPQTDTEDTSPDTTVGFLCSQISNQFIPYDASTTALVCNCEVPGAIAEYLGTRAESYQHRAFRPVEISTTGGLALNLIQSMGDAAAAESPHEFDADRPQEVSVTFNGESVPLYGQTPANDPGTETIATSRLDGSLPYSVEGTTRYFPVMIQLSLQAGESIPDNCRDTVTAAAHRIAETLQSNPQSTVVDYL